MPKPIWSTMLTFAIAAAGGAAGTGTVLALAGHNPEVETINASMPAARTLPVSMISAMDSGGKEPIADLVQRVGPAVVNIDTVSNAAVPQDQFFFPFGSFFGAPFQNQEGMQMPQMVEKGIGSGFVVRQDGLIATNYHVVKNAQQLTVTFPDGRTAKGKVVGKDPGEDLALVKIDASNLPTLPLADPRTLRVGQWVVAIGSPLGYQHTVTAGIISAMNRTVDDLNDRIDFLQTDAPINPGNSGGPLLDLRGEVVGINTAIAAQAQGIGFAIPVDVLSHAIPQLEAHGSVERAWLGVGVQDLPANRNQMFYPSDHGALVMQVSPDSPAAKAGLQQGDIILSVDGHEVDSAQDLIRMVGEEPIGARVNLEVQREGQHKTFALSLAKMPDQLANE